MQILSNSGNNAQNHTDNKIENSRMHSPAQTAVVVSSTTVQLTILRDCEAMMASCGDLFDQQMDTEKMFHHCGDQ